MQRIAVGIDLAAKSESPTGVCIVVEGKLIDCVKAWKDKEIHARSFSHGRPLVVAIDAPLTNKSRGFRLVELEMIRKGMRLLPLGLPYMRLLAKRGLILKKMLEKEGVKVIETHPTSSLKYAGCTRDALLPCLSRYISVSHDRVRVGRNRDLVDAAVAACVAWLYINKGTHVFRGPDGEIHLLPKALV